MPTGYTAAIKDGISFEKFVWTCARAFGACVTMREDSSDARVPERFEPSNWHLEKLNEIEAKIAQITAMSDVELTAAANAAHREVVAYQEKRDGEKATLRMQYEDMAVRVSAWSPPEDCVELKKFMTQQIADSLLWDCYDAASPVQEQRTGVEWREHMLQALRQELEYHGKSHAEEIERVEKRNAWLAALRSSVPQP
jgi:hypothetical protein